MLIIGSGENDSSNYYIFNGNDCSVDSSIFVLVPHRIDDCGGCKVNKERSIIGLEAGILCSEATPHRRGQNKQLERRGRLKTLPFFQPMKSDSDIAHATYIPHMIITFYLCHCALPSIRLRRAFGNHLDF